jgi:hypothetical protein
LRTVFTSRLVVVFSHAAEPNQMIAPLPNHPIRQEINAIICRSAVKDIVSVHPLRHREWLSEKVTSHLRPFDI